ncbi:MAG: hypothetical protein HWD59_03290 [Coxiellaceae bacterium]|nr:MAG: hypothetical protein HWD59_03290 [Coxiellaceae bacterium]
MSRSDITLEQLNQIGIDGLRKLLPHPLPVYRLTQKVYIPLLKLIHFDEETRQALIQYSSDIAKLVEEDHVSWTELLDLSPSAVNAIKNASNQVKNLSKHCLILYRQLNGKTID